MKSGSLNLLEPSGPVQACNGIAFYSFLLEAESTPIPVTPSGIEPATYRLIAQCVNQLRYRVPQMFVIIQLK
jgi:hypothetical protein